MYGESGCVKGWFGKSRLCLIVVWLLLRLQWRRHETLPRLLDRVVLWRGIPVCVGTAEAVDAVACVFHHARRIPGLWVSCIPRGVVLAALLRDSPGTCLKIGFSPITGHRQGHAWLSREGEPLMPEDSELLARHRYAAVTSLPLRLHRRIH